MPRVVSCFVALDNEVTKRFRSGLSFNPSVEMSPHISPTTWPRISPCAPTVKIVLPMITESCESVWYFPSPPISSGVRRLPRIGATCLFCKPRALLGQVTFTSQRAWLDHGESHVQCTLSMSWLPRMITNPLSLVGARDRRSRRIFQGWFTASDI